MKKNLVNFKQMMKPKMVRMVRRNILYDGDLEICDSKSELGRKSKQLRFRKFGLRGGQIQVWGSKWSLLNRFQRRKCSSIYSGLIRHHPGSIFIYKIMFVKKHIEKKTMNFKKHREQSMNIPHFYPLWGAYW